MPDRLFGVEAKKRWTGSRALVPVERVTCPECDGEMVEHGEGQPSLFRHGGYGAVRFSRRSVCADCGWGVTFDVTEIKP